MKKIKTLEGLQHVVLGRKAVVCPTLHCFSKPIPAAFVINLQGCRILPLIEAGLYIYDRKEVK